MTLYRRQILALTLVCWIFVIPGLWKSGTNVVTDTYERAANHFWQGGNVYAAPDGHGDWFKYSPLFAALYGVFTLLHEKAEALAWALVGISVFWAGVSRWFLFNRGSPPWMWVALALAAMELDISTRYQQVNALIVGVVLLGLGEAREARWDRAAAFLALGTNLKILPVVFAGLLGFPMRARYWAWFVGASALLLAVPALRLGWLANWNAHATWLNVITHDLQARGILDIGTVVGRLGWGDFGNALRWTILGTSVGLMAWMRRPAAWADWGHWYTLGATALLLFSPRTESPTFVLLAPGYLFLMRDALHQRGGQRALGIAVTLTGMFFITFVFSDLWPRAIWNPRAIGHVSKTWGTLGLWGWTFARAFKRV
jgi:hypothetical protein